MARTYYDHFYIIDPASPPAGGTPLTPVNMALVDQNEDSNITTSGGDTVDGSDITGTFVGDVIEVQAPDGTIISIRGVTYYLADGRQVFTPLDGKTLNDATYQSTTTISQDPNGTVRPESLMPVCFTSGTLLAGADGQPVLIDDLKPGCMVQVTTDGLSVAKAIRWIGRRTISADQLAAYPSLRPVRITAGALGGGLPLRDLVVSRQHRIMTDSPIARRMFGHAQVLLPAFRLTGLPGVFVDEAARDVTYIHLLFDQHEIVTAEGAATESMYTGPEALYASTTEAREEILAIFPELASDAAQPEMARHLPPGHAQRRLIERHVKNGVPLFHQ